MVLPIETKNDQYLKDVLSKYNESLHWFHSFITDLTGKRYIVEKPSKDRLKEYEEQMQRTKTFLDFLGNPQESFFSVHIAGTGGKGSTSMMIGKILEGVSSKVGVHTSPFLQVPGEKFLINGQMIPPSKLVKTTDDLKAKYEEFKRIHPDISLRYGEMWVAFTYLYFGQSNLDWGVIETGMGGRFDPTNILDPKLSVITNIDLDHVPQLGTTIPEIAWHKAGIIKPGRAVVTREDKEEALQVFRKETKEKGSPLYCFGKDFSWDLLSQSKNGIVIDVNAPYGNYTKVEIPLLGSFQAENAALAIVAVDILAHQYNLDIDSSIINKQLQEIYFPGRMEIIQKEPTVILDGAHNPQKTTALAKSMLELYPGKKYVLICGMLGTKDAQSSITQLLPQAKRVIVSQPQVIGKPGIEATTLAKIVKNTGFQGPVEIYPEVPIAIEQTLKKANIDDVILVTGSLYMLGEARNYWVPVENILLNAEKIITKI